MSASDNHRDGPARPVTSFKLDVVLEVRVPNGREVERATLRGVFRPEDAPPIEFTIMGDDPDEALEVADIAATALDVALDAPGNSFTAEQTAAIYDAVARLNRALS